MARRKLQLGDDLSGRKLYFTLSASDTTTLDSLVYENQKMWFATTGKWAASMGYNSYSLGTRYYAGIYSPSQYDYAMDGSLYLEFPELDFVTFSWYSGHTNADIESGPCSVIECPNNFGTIWYLDTSSKFYPLIEIDDSEIPSTLFIGNSRVSEIYIGTEKISSIFSNIGECGENFFVLNNWYWSTFEIGQTWKEWIDQDKYWPYPETFTWSYDDNGVYFDDGTCMLDGVLPTDKIILYHNYEGGRACLSGDTLIQTKEGVQAISTLKAGDLLDNNNAIEKIVQHNRNYYYEIILDNEDVIKASNDHQFICNDKIVKTEDLQINDKLNDLIIVNIKRINKTLDMYEIKTTTNQYSLFNGIICESENI